MSRFSADWLTLREPYDLRARNLAVLDAVIAWCKDFLAIRIVDLGCGTGSTLRALAPRLPGRQDWRLFDNDFDLVARAATIAPPATVTITATPLDLSRDLEASLDGSIDLITASALLDLVSESWLEQLVVEISARSIPLYAAISHDGRIEIVPSDPFDTTIVAAVNLHHRTDKGFGPALGGTSASFAIARLKSFGYSVIHGTSDWVLEPHDCDVQMQLFSSWAATARQTGQASVDTRNWLAADARRLQLGNHRSVSVTSTSGRTRPVTFEQRGHNRTTCLGRANVRALSDCLLEAIAIDMEDLGLHKNLNAFVNENSL